MVRVIFLLLVSLPALVAAQPVIHSLSIEEGDVTRVYIDGSGFGAQGPNVVFFANFSNGDALGPVPFEAQVGSFSEIDGNAICQAVSGDMGALFVNEGLTHQAKVNFGG